MPLAGYVAALVILSLLPLLFSVARLAAKHFRRLPWAIDDTLLLLALVLQYLLSRKLALLIA